MRKLFFLFAFALLSAAAAGQTIQITESSATAVTGGVNVNVKTISFNGAGYLSHTYTINGNTIDLSVCYYFNMLLPVLTFDNDFFIPVTQSGDYTVNITVYNSSSTEVCDYFSSGGSATHNVLATKDLDLTKSLGLYPNPTTGALFLDTVTDGPLYVYDQLGRLVMQTNASSAIDLSPLTSGVYIVSGKIDEQTLNQKIIKN
ncbi:hypothetical protein FLLO111716_02490 [Flavobacterium longum]|uniref:T9SS type A sorting domain-containing protein n=1 Tax=Flavobacterium longum TaxID=1299340 RepID=UPI0039ECAB47